MRSDYNSNIREWFYFYSIASLDRRHIVEYATTFDAIAFDDIVALNLCIRRWHKGLTTSFALAQEMCENLEYWAKWTNGSSIIR